MSDVSCWHKTEDKQHSCALSDELWSLFSHVLYRFCQLPGTIHTAQISQHVVSHGRRINSQRILRI